MQTFKEYVRESSPVVQAVSDTASFVANTVKRVPRQVKNALRIPTQTLPMQDLSKPSSETNK